MRHTFDIAPLITGARLLYFSPMGEAPSPRPETQEAGIESREAEVENREQVPENPKEIADTEAKETKKAVANETEKSREKAREMGQRVANMALEALGLDSREETIVAEGREAEEKTKEEKEKQEEASGSATSVASGTARAQ